MASTGITILGSTGSVGCSTLDVISLHPDRFQVVALTAHSEVQLLARQCKKFGARYAVASAPGMPGALKSALKALHCNTEVIEGVDALETVAGMEESGSVMAAIVGAAGLRPSLHAARLGKKLLLANKESMVIAGELFARSAQQNGAVIIPVDSEHNALFQALPAHFDGDLEACGVEHLVLTASGGPFLDTPLPELEHITPEQACKHPNWEMGRKISVDSATLMNKGLEVIEARWLFNARPNQIKVVVHPQSIVHSMVAYRDGSVIAQMGMPDMRTPIAHALGWPDRIDAGVEPLHLPLQANLEFREPDFDRFPCLSLAYAALNSEGNSPVLLNAANECAVEAFLDRRISFLDIPALVDQVMQTMPWAAINSLEDVIDCDLNCRAIALEEIKKMSKRHA